MFRSVTRLPLPLGTVLFRLLVSVLVSLLLSAAVGCGPSAAYPLADSAAGPGDPAEAIEAGVASGVPVLRPVVRAVLPHDTSAWTQGLEIADGKLYESTGGRGDSRLRELDPTTGAVVRETAVPEQLYGEGITVAGSRIWQLTWQDGVVLGWDRASLTPRERLPWPGEGWGLCRLSNDRDSDSDNDQSNDQNNDQNNNDRNNTDHEGRIIASDGSDRLRILAGADLAQLGSLPVRIAGRPVSGLNELECVGDTVWANVWQTDWLVRIDVRSGEVIETVNAGNLLTERQRADADVLNGIAAIPGTDEFLITGKLWPTLFRVRFAR